MIAASGEAESDKQGQTGHSLPSVGGDASAAAQDEATRLRPSRSQSQGIEAKK